MLVDRPTRDLSLVVGSVLHDPLWFYWVEYGDDLFVVCARSVDEVHEVVQRRAQEHARLRSPVLGGDCAATPRLCVTRVANRVEE